MAVFDWRGIGNKWQTRLHSVCLIFIVFLYFHSCSSRDKNFIFQISESNGIFIQKVYLNISKYDKIYTDFVLVEQKYVFVYLHKIRKSGFHINLNVNSVKCPIISWKIYFKTLLHRITSKKNQNKALNKRGMKTMREPLAEKD